MSIESRVTSNKKRGEISEFLEETNEIRYQDQDIYWRDLIRRRVPRVKSQSKIHKTNNAEGSCGQ